MRDSVYTEIHQPEYLSPVSLDTYLEQGWFRMGQMIFTCHFLCFHNQLYSAIWTRLALNGYGFSKRQRKLLSRNKCRFVTKVRPAIFNQEKEELYQKHCHRFEGYVARTLEESLFGDSNINIYNTYEVAVFDGDRLVAVSFFDVGASSLASIMGLYDPDYARHSLGYYTMLIEILFGIQHNMQFYYPGYVVPGYERFDYKLRIGAMDYYEYESREWIPYKGIDTDQLPAERMVQALSELQDALDAAKVPSRLLLYPLYDKKLFGLKQEESVRNPLLLVIDSREDQHKWIIAEYELSTKQFRISEVHRIEEASLLIYQLFKDYDLNKSCLNFLVREQTLFNADVAQQVTQQIKRLRVSGSSF
ncbi:MAG: arginine-tRNA-protein transferase [Bacteroidota bacterium]